MCSITKAASAPGVIDRFADEYAQGRTPVPCSLCNQGVKFVDLIAFARDLGADCLATGHYVRRVEREGRVELWKGRDPSRDQSYFLYGTTADQLDYLRFPLGDLPKSETRKLAAEEGLIVADKPDSQDICFVPDGDYAGLVKRLRPETAAPGEIVDLEGRVLGQHEGVVHFTIGQRRGIEIGGQPEPLYVVRIEPEERRLVVGPAPRCWRSAPPASRASTGSPRTRRAVEAKVRSWRGRWRALGRRAPDLRHPEYGVAPGQSAVFYDGER